MKKMFIAGAVCPACNQMDKVFVYQKEGGDVAQCNACGHVQVRPTEAEARAASESPSNEQEQAVRFIVSPKPDKS